ncbi:MAG: isoquinoline 1-oxidoreductase alpha subunit [Gammaproteobacteria bacterium]|jgi:isoquinoline 1-oxidoreductase alpha subunit
MAVQFSLNGRETKFDGAADMPLLWYLRDYAGLTGTKFGCGIAACGACTVHVDGKAVRSCVTPVSSLADKAVTTIEGLETDGQLHAVQQAWIEEDVPQCGYCQAGQLMAAADLLARNDNPDDADISEITNLCRCGTYSRIRSAIKRAAGLLAASKQS